MGGFLEDIPVLVFVLAGVVTLIGASVWAASMRSDLVREAELESLADDLVDQALWRFSDSEGGCVSVDRLAQLDFSELSSRVPDGTGWLVSVNVIHPWEEQLVLAQGGDEHHVANVGFGCKLINASYGTDGGAVVKVTAVVWRSW
ncbi:MAG: hypothetical protein LN411_03885 [Candidatus Thermoplasmatota archaeon]|nr:hypothetical protein [Candidatus Thermoplasmatota archaeon]